MSLKKIFEMHVDDVTAFCGGAGVTLLGWIHLDPGVIVGKILMTFILGLVGGFAGLLSKEIWKSLLKIRKYAKISNNPYRKHDKDFRGDSSGRDLDGTGKDR